MTPLQNQRNALSIISHVHVKNQVEVYVNTLMMCSWWIMIY